MSKVLHLDIFRCDDCPYCRYEETDEDAKGHYVCTEAKLGADHIINAEDWFSKNEVPLPSWCPLSDKD